MSNLVNYQNACYAQCIIFTVSGAALLFAPDQISGLFVRDSTLRTPIVSDLWRGLGALHWGAAALFCNDANADRSTRRKIIYASTVLNSILFGYGVYLLGTGRWRNSASDYVKLIGPSGIMTGVFGYLALNE
eukprot:TRINITY_DN90_c0_g1_i1.p1 TRINITY_DN90_c0_g1~~TRINITY_DN90_c0_g1_i1.p1  ORF type:complete len:132 (+),score=26.79 TRINITY_DN90_c0_g1_i1:84-479(+)